MTDSERVDVPVWEYLEKEGARINHMAMMVKTGHCQPVHALLEVMFSYADTLSVLSQQQKARDEGK
jgi:hypothetical protein